ncbi:MAG TPA: methyltransferase domain-containing protein [Acidimicrobiales bacterium]|jgi:SAM-dependent methyltransferase|nr:methyltransferase domain-containing protein [Acidimicrobiales bacterium]
MAPKALQPLVPRVRAGLRRLARRRPAARRLMMVAAKELARALDDDVYSSSYFGAGRDPLDRMGLSGYERYDRDTSNANAAAYMVWKHFDVRRALDVGCATGFVVEGLRELGIDAAGTDVSQYAIEHAALGAAGHLVWGDLTDRLPFKTGQFELVTALETLEHLPPDIVPQALAELRRVTSGYLVCTIPSFGPNEHGPGGWLQVKARDERLDHYYGLGPSYEGPLPYEDIFRDDRGEPIEGHLTMASFSWWTKQFEAAGFVRVGEVERRIHPDLARFGLTKYWNLYVLRVPSAPVPVAGLRAPDEVAEVERRFSLDARVADPEDLKALADAGLE